MQKNTLIVRFNELKYFTSIVSATSTSNNFNGCKNLESIYTYNITNISGNSNQAPFCDTKIVNLYLPKIKTVGQYSFANPGWVNNSSSASIGPLRIVVLGASLTNFNGQQAISYSNKINIFIYATTPPTCSTTLSYNGYPQYIYVPDDSYNAYIENASYANYKSRIKPLSEYTGEKPWEELYPEELGLN